MKNINLFYCVGIMILLILASWQPKRNADLTEPENNKITLEIEGIVDHFFNPNNLNYAHHVGLRANREGYIYAGDGKIQHSDYESYRSRTESSFKNIRHFTEVKRLRTSIYVLSPDAATCTVEFKSKFLKVTGDTIVNNGCWTMVFKKFDEGWKIIQENGSHTK